MTREKVLQKKQQEHERENRLKLSKKQKNINQIRQKRDAKGDKYNGRYHNASWKRDTGEPSIRIDDSWLVVQEIDFSQFNKLSLPMTQEPEDLLLCGAMSYYNKTFDRLSTRNPQKLTPMNRLVHNVSTMDDPVIRQLASENAGNVFATDGLIACLMCCPRSVDSWDITARRIGDILILDKRPDNTTFDHVTVNETATNPPQNDANNKSNINSATNLSLEATFINHNFTQQVLRNDRCYAFPNPNPFIDADDDTSNVSSIGYRYRRFDLGNDIRLVCRCEHDAVVENSDENAPPQFLTVRALNEWDSRIAKGMDWRTKLDVQRGAVVGSEIKNNAFKLAKWTATAMLAGSDQLKLGYVSRVAANGNNAHVVLGTQQYKPVDFATQINLKMENAWGVLRSIIDLCMKLEPGLYLIMKKNNERIVKVYGVPSDAFDDDDDEESDEESHQDN